MRFTVFSRPGCSACDQLKGFLRLHKIEYRDIDGSSAEGRTYMLTENIFLSYYPALRVDTRLYEYSHLFDEHGNLLIEEIRLILGIDPRDIPGASS